MKNSEIADMNDFESGETVKVNRRFVFTQRTVDITISALFVLFWVLLVFYESTQLFRIQDLSLFLTTELFFDEMMSAPAGLLSYVACFLVQFFYYPILGATIYVAMLYAVYRLVRMVFEISGRWSLLALLPVVLLVSTNLYMGYWIYYIKVQGYFYVALLGLIFVLLSLQAYKKLPVVAKFVFLILWSVATYPFLGVYALVASFLMGVMSFSVTQGTFLRLSLFLLSVAAVVVVPACYYRYYTGTSFALMYLSGVPAYQWTIFGEDWFVQKVWVMWIPYILLFVTMLMFCVFYRKKHSFASIEKHYTTLQIVVLAFVLCYTYAMWYNNGNFRAELAQSEAMWNEDWSEVERLGKVDETPTRLIVMNRNIALLRNGRAGEEMFRFPDGSADIDAPISVRLTQTGGKMAYYQYGKFNFCYRWCVEDAVEFGWKFEYLKHAVRSMIASGELKLAHRYIEILKHSLFYKKWAERYEALLLKPERIRKEREFSVPMQFACYNDGLEVDDSFVEAYLLNSMTTPHITNPSPLYTEAALMHALIRKDTQLFWNTMVAYLNNHRTSLRIPTHYQEALLLYANIDRRADISKFNFDASIQQRFRNFMKKTGKYKGMKEEQMAPYFKDDFGDTYWYFYFFVRDIKSN